MGKDISVTIEAIPVENTDPELVVYQLTLEDTRTEGGVWCESFTKVDDIKTFERGLRAMAAMSKIVSPEFPEIPIL